MAQNSKKLVYNEVKETSFFDELLDGIKTSQYIIGF